MSTTKNSIETTYTVAVSVGGDPACIYPVEGFRVTAKGDLTPVFDGGLDRTSFGPMANIVLRPNITVAGLLTTPHGLAIGKRPEGKKSAGLWEIAGGKPERGESDEEALKRELREEYGLVDVWVGAQVAEVAVTSPFRARVYLCHTDAEPEALEHDEVRFLRGTDEMPQPWEFVPGNYALVESYFARWAYSVAKGDL